LDPAILAGLTLCLLGSIFFSITDSALAHFTWSGLDGLAKTDAQRDRLRRHLAERRRYQLACFALNSVGNVVFVVLMTRELLAQSTATGHVVLAVVYSLGCVLVLGDVVPRAWGQGNADRWLFHTFPAVHIIAQVVLPFTWVLALINTVVGRLAGVHMARSDKVEYGDEIRSMVTDGEKAGVLEEEEREMIASIFELHAIDAAEVMTPRTDMVCIEADASLDELRTLATRCGFSRIPVFRKTRDNIVGVVHVKDLLANGDGKAKAGDVAQKPCFVPETKHVHELLQELRDQKIHMAIVLDEYGGTAGLITLEDIVEEIVGEIEDEYDEEPPEPIKTIDGHTIECDGRLPIDDLNDALDIEVPEDESYDTVSGFVSAELGHIAAEGESCRWQNVEFTVLSATDRAIRRLHVVVHPEEGNGGDH
jgi:CBS domain containing-hemolysin-like protein